MHKYWTAILNMLICFFSVFGVLIFLFFARGLFPDSAGLVGMPLFHILLCMGIAFVLTLSHTVIASEYLDQYLSIKFRVIFCGILCTIALGVFTVYYGIPSLIVLLMGLENTLSSTLTWVIAFVFCFILTILFYCLVERNFQSIGKKYDKALSAYKKKAGQINEIDNFKCQ